MNILFVVYCDSLKIHSGKNVGMMFVFRKYVVDVINIIIIIIIIIGVFVFYSNSYSWFRIRITVVSVEHYEWILLPREKNITLS
mmetsp:Transcript_50209/g.51082  ORF Transcript_50209/g.51082 Transcript_50209/m.51082 type:complete len:84 (+) Transcript_50209:157-408(+)